MNSYSKRFLLVAGGLLAALATVEFGLRVFGPGSEPAHETYLLDSDGQPATLERALQRGDVEYGPPPRGRPRYVRAQTFYICYRGGVGPSQDERGCVRVDINGLGLRDRADLTYEKPAGQRRVVCLGDSFTFGWGVSVDRAWPRLIEPKLQSHGKLRTINCGLAGTLLIDESWWALRDRFGRFDPDVVVLTVCLNDLVPMPNTIGLFREHTLEGCSVHDHWIRWTCEDCIAAAESRRTDTTWLAQSRLYQLLQGGHRLRTRAQLEPGIDWGQWLLDMPVDWPSPYSPLDAPKTHFELQGIPPEATWTGGGPQRALVEMKQWCDQRRVPLGVVVWPLLQGLETGAQYPFETLHRVVRDFCAAERIPCLDLLPEFRGRDAADLWVDPSDMHANEEAHRAAAGPIASFVDGLLPR